jgi:dTDP-4-amino-4,6-dideoxygalactose transaminase
MKLGENGGMNARPVLATNDLRAKVGARGDALRIAFERVLHSGRFILGSEVTRFENAFAEYLGARACIGVGNGTDAIEIALRACGVREDGLVGTVANASMYATNSILAIGATPHFMDVDAATSLVSLAQAQAALDAGCTALVVPHLYGKVIPQIGAIVDACAAKNAILVEDCAQAHGAAMVGRRAGTLGHAASFSFYPTKNLGALGDGGAVVTNDERIAEEARRLRQYGWTEKYTVGRAGGRNSRLDELQGAFLSELLPHLDRDNGRRRDIAARYASAIRNPAVSVPEVAGEDHVVHLYVVRCGARESLRAHLLADGIACDIHYPVPDHRQPVFEGRFSGVALPNTERLAEEVLTLPCYPELRDEDVDRVAAAINAWKP